MKIKLKFPAVKNRPSEIEITVREAAMVQPFEAHGRKSICALLDRKGWDSAWERLEELGVKVYYRKTRPMVNVDEVRIASQKWFKKHRVK